MRIDYRHVLFLLLGGSMVRGSDCMVVEFRVDHHYKVHCYFTSTKHNLSIIKTMINVY